MPWATVAIPKSDLQAYKRGYPDGTQFVTYNDDIMGIGMLRNAILKMAGKHVSKHLIMFDDDISKLYCMVGNGHPLDSDCIRPVVENCYECAKGAGAKLFGFSQTWDARIFRGHDPISFTTRVGSVVGCIELEPCFDEKLMCRADNDATLTRLMVDRICWTDERYSFVCERDSNPGGSSTYKTYDRIVQESIYLKRKWGKYITVNNDHFTQGITLGIKCPRRRAIRIEA
jgi:hypothetical protein